MKHLTLLIGLLTGFGLVGFSQAGPIGQRTLASATSAAGIYIYLYGTEAELAQADGSTFIIERALWNDTSKTPSFKRAGEAQPADSRRALTRFIPVADQQQMARDLGLPGAEALPTYIASHPKAEDYGLYYITTQTRLAVGHVWRDESARLGNTYLYRVQRVAPGGSRTLWGTALQYAKAGNDALSLYQPRFRKRQVADSSVLLTWAIPKPRLPLTIKEQGVAPAALRNETQFDPGRMLGHAWISLNEAPARQVRLFLQRDSVGDTLRFSYRQRCRPDDEITAWAASEDEIGNLGPYSDTSYTLALTSARAPLINGIHVRDTVDGLRISWPPLPWKSYLTGVSIYRYNSQDKLDSVATLSPIDTTYTDYAIQPGQHYRYAVRALFARSTGIAQKIPAQGVGTYSIFSKPYPPQGLEAKTEGRNIRLAWQAATGRGLYGYYIYRGTSQHRLQLVGGPVKSNAWVDTAHSLSGGSIYYYGVASQNLRQDTSLMSSLVGIKPLRRTLPDRPGTIETYYVNGLLKLSWTDTRRLNSHITGYSLQKRLTGQEFAHLGAGLYQLPFAQDSGLARGVGYQYRVASVTAEGDTSAYSDAVLFTLAQRPVETVSLFYLRSTSKGVAVSWPAVTYAGRKGYLLYRRRPADARYSLLTTLAADELAYEDQTAKPGQTYIYALATVLADNRQGEPGPAQSIVYRPAPKPTIAN